MEFSSDIIRQPVKFVKDTETELRDLTANPNLSNQQKSDELYKKIAVIAANIDTIADITADNPTVQKTLSTILNRSLAIVQASDGPKTEKCSQMLMDIANKVSQAAHVTFPEFKDQFNIATGKASANVLMSHEAFMHMCDESPLFKSKFYPPKDQGQHSVELKGVTQDAWQEISSFYADKVSSASWRMLPIINMGFTPTNEAFDVIRTCHELGLKEGEKYFTQYVGETLPRVIQATSNLTDSSYSTIPAHMLVGYLRELIDFAFEVNSPELKKIGVEGFHTALSAIREQMTEKITDFYGKINDQTEEGFTLLEKEDDNKIYAVRSNISQSLWTMRQFIAPTVQKVRSEHGDFDERLISFGRPYLELYETVSKIPPHSLRELKARQDLLLHLLQEGQKSNLWDVSRKDGDRLVQIEANSVLEFIDQIAMLESNPMSTDVREQNLIDHFQEFLKGATQTLYLDKFDSSLKPKKVDLNYIYELAEEGKTAPPLLS